MRHRVEVSTLSLRGVGTYNEDSYFVGIDPRCVVAGVFDGATAVVDEVRLRWPSAPRDAARTAVQALRTLPMDMGPREAILEVNRAVRGLNARHEIDWDDPAQLAAVVGVVVKLDLERDVASCAYVGDSAVIFDRGMCDPTFFTSYLFEKYSRKTFDRMAALRARGILDAEVQATLVLDQLLENRRSANLPGGEGHGMINGMESLAEYVEVQENLDLESFESVVLITDGLFPPGMASREADMARLIVDLLRSGGPGALAEYVRSAESADPTLQHSRYKLHDDATGVVIRLT